MMIVVVCHHPHAPLSLPRSLASASALALLSAGPILLGAESPAGGLAGSALGEHLGLQQAQLHQYCAVQAQADLVCADRSCGWLD